MEYLIIILIVVGLYLVMNCKNVICRNDQHYTHEDELLDGGSYGNEQPKKVGLPTAVKRKTRKRTDKAIKPTTRRTTRKVNRRRGKSKK